MNIAIFSPNRNPYSETFIQAHKTYLNGRIFYYFGSKHRLQLEGKDQLISRPEQKLFRIKKYLFRKSNSWLAEQRILSSIYKNQIDVLLIEYGTHAHHLLPILKQLDIPVVVHFHGYDASMTSVVENTNYYKEVFHLASKVIVVSRVMEKMLYDMGCPKEKVVYNVYGPQPEFESITPSFDKKQFVSVGRFTDKKAPYYTILAFKKVIERHSDAKLIFAGEGDLLNTCKNLVKHFNLDKNIQFLGVISPKDYRELLSDSLAYVQHSITAISGDMEGTPLAILEASVAGLPVVATIHAGIPDVIIHGDTGLLCEEHDVDTMSKHMLMVIDDVDLAKEMGRKAKAHILKYFNIQRHIDQLYAILSKVSNAE
ncbi:glycosyltransferase family 4 protein [uncultured Psychroserpens sp.]|uniref:glycosyltransferase family 4 protein n=1 Tax=uncultured Psychroserpens sp. TaxID=255436 RepID=UPI0026018603|nr:glycosyltransferase family 4 protein [uncultured Psychroserpens sp.]